MKKMFIALGFLVVVNFVIASKANAALIGYWNFNEGLGDVANDSSGFGNDATGLNSSWIAGKHGYGTNSSSIIVQPDASLLPSSSLTISAWARIDEFNGLQRRIAEMEYRYGLLFNPPNIDSQTAFYLNLNSDNYSFEYQDIPLGEWFHTAVSWDGNIAQYYINGIPVTPVVADAVINQNGGIPLFMGAEGYSLDEVRIYNNALSREEILRDMNFDSTVIPEPTTLFLLGSGILGTLFSRRKLFKARRC
ncbi:MAG TPA: PEP-CTERM sorting domain-containing protein [Candidatus Omnitrophota bacterium]|nr:PEP-CTERM sorting domain-containing protein [Candidatus Omnitrophota bacterium]HPD83926.1 PEP-CTERM sorting domain-containing protein [Candidatus Omnitrophota bacterium]HRZ02783.1 PEP-CTERM sorting domain-containing protein [Candidatus Omnitrophota bacterium]